MGSHYLNNIMTELVGLVMIIWLALPCLHAAEPDVVWHTVTITEDFRMVSDYSKLMLATRDSERSSGNDAIRMPMERRSSSSAEKADDQLREAIQRSHARVNALSESFAAAQNPSSSSVEGSVYAMSFEFLTTVQIGTPPQDITVIVDTGSDLVWTQCQPCEDCFTQPQPLYDPSQSSTFAELPCKNNSYCTFLSTNGAGSTCNSQHQCSYSYSYGDNSYTTGILSTETLTLTTTKDTKTSFPTFVFGCGRDNGPNDSFSNSSGIVGLGQGLVSINSQLGSAIDYKFSYCLVPWDSPPSVKGTLLMGNDSITKGPKTLSIPIITNNALDGIYQTFYYVSLQGASVGGNLLNISNGTFDIQPDGSGGLIVDSGTTITYLEEVGYELILEAFTSLIKLEKNTTQQDLDLCYVLPTPGDFKVPSFTLHFENGDLNLPPENYFITYEGNLCLAMGGNIGFSILGNIQQQNTELGYDVKNKLLSMTPKSCATT